MDPAMTAVGIPTARLQVAGESCVTQPLYASDPRRAVRMRDLKVLTTLVMKLEAVDVVAGELFFLDLVRFRRGWC